MFTKYNKRFDFQNTGTHVLLVLKEKATVSNFYIWICMYIPVKNNKVSLLLKIDKKGTSII